MNSKKSRGPGFMQQVFIADLNRGSIEEQQHQYDMEQQRRNNGSSCNSATFMYDSDEDDGRGMSAGVAAPRLSKREDATSGKTLFYGNLYHKKLEVASPYTAEDLAPDDDSSSSSSSDSEKKRVTTKKKKALAAKKKKAEAKKNRSASNEQAKPAWDMDLETGSQASSRSSRSITVNGMSLQLGSGSSGYRKSGSRLASLIFGDDYTRLKRDFVSEMRYLSKLRHPCITTVMGKLNFAFSVPTKIM